MDTTEREDNNALYFIVGGLVVLALIFGFIYVGNNTVTTAAPERITERTTETKIIPVPTAPAPANNTTNYNFGTDKTANPDGQ